jgi:hypothetical protein
MVFPSGCKKITGKMGKSSIPVLSAQKPWFSQGFCISAKSVPLAVCCAHATRCMAECGVAFRVALPKSSRF